MRCFVHHDQEAVGVCRACGKGLCPDCTVDLVHSISCRGACEAEAQERHAQSIRSRALLNAQIRQHNYLFLPALFLVMGVGMAGFSWDGDHPFNLGTAMGAGVIVFGLIALMLNKRLRKAMNRNQL